MFFLMPSQHNTQPKLISTTVQQSLLQLQMANKNKKNEDPVNILLGWYTNIIELFFNKTKTKNFLHQHLNC